MQMLALLTDGEIDSLIEYMKGIRQILKKSNVRKYE
jgi:hypothetical protein